MLLKGKKALIIGVVNERSLAYSIAKKLKEEGAEIALTYVNESIQRRVEPIAQELSASFILPFDATCDEHYEQLKQSLSEKWGTFDILVHSIAFTQTSDLKGRFIDTSKAGFQLALEVSCFSLVGLCKSLEPLLNEKSSIMTLSYQGACAVVPGYNVMGVAKSALESSARYLAYELGPKKIRVNAISAGPVKTLAASAVGNFKTALSHVEAQAPIKENISGEDVAGAALYLASDLSQKVTGQTLYVDSGLSIMAP